MTEELLPKPELNLPLPHLQVPEQGNGEQAEKEIPAHLASQGLPLQGHKTKWLILFLVLATVILVGIAGAKYFLDQQKLKAINDFESCTAAGFPVMESYPARCATSDGRSFTQILSEEEQKNLLPPDPTTDWKIYEGDGFSFKYPADFLIENNNSIINIKPNSSITEKDPSKYFTIGISAESLSKNSNLLSFIKSKQYITLGKSRKKIFKDEDIKPYTVNGLNGYYWFGGFEYMGYHIYFENNGIVYIFTFNKDEAGIFPEPQKTEPNELDQILSTLTFSASKFTDSKISCTPRPSCFDTEPRCLMPVTEDMCPPSPTPSI